MTGHCARCGTDADPKSDYMPTADEAYRFIQSNPRVAASFMLEAFKLSREDSRYSNGRLREIWKLAGGAVDAKKNRAWIETDLLAGVMRFLNEVPGPKCPEGCKCGYCEFPGSD